MRCLKNPMGNMVGIVNKDLTLAATYTDGALLNNTGVKITTTTYYPLWGVEHSEIIYAINSGGAYS
jgi:hypothetical protein